MDIDYIDNYFVFQLEKLEDEFLGVEITPNIFVERIFYPLNFPTDEEYRVTKKKDSLYYSENNENSIAHTSINYNEIDFDYWSHYLYQYLQEFLEQNESKRLIKEINTYLQSDIDFQTKKFTLNHLKNRTGFSVEMLKELQEKSDLNHHQKPLIDIYIQFYNSFLNTINNNKYTPYYEVKKTTSTIGVGKTVFGKNFDFIENLYTQLWSKDFIDKEQTTKEEFLKHFFVENISENKIILTGSNLADLGFLINSLKYFFLEDYRNASYFKEFWANRFLFSTNKKKEPFSKDINTIKNIINSDRKPQRRVAINDIIQNLKPLPQ